MRVENFIPEHAPSLIDRLNNMPLEKLPEIGARLNQREWPEELGAVPKTEEREAVINILLSCVRSRVGWKAILREAHKRDEGLTGQAFDDWWDSQGNWWDSGSSAQEELQRIVDGRVIANCYGMTELLHERWMTISEAVSAALSYRCSIARKAWKGTGLKITPTNTKKCCIISSPKKPPAPHWQPSAADLIAGDWLLVK